MAKSGAGKPTKPTRAERKAARTEKRQQRRETWASFRQAFTMTRQEDRRLLPYLIIATVLGAAVPYIVVFFVLGSPFVPIGFAIIGAALAGMITFSRRAQRMTYAKAEGTPGAAAWMLQNNLRGDWRVEKDPVAGTAQLDAIYRLLGRPGVILVGEGAAHRVRGLIAQEKKRISRIAGEAPIYDFVVGTGEGETALRKLNIALSKLPRNLSKSEVATLEKRLQALGGRRMPLPQGPMPAGTKMRNVQRAARRRS